MAVLTTEELNQKESRGRTLSTDELNEMESVSQVFVNIDPEVASKRTTSYILSKELGLEPDVVGATYSSIVKNIYGESLKASEVEKRMQESGLLANPQADQADVEEISQAMLNNFKLPQATIERMARKRINKQTADIFARINKEDEDLFLGPTVWAQGIRDKKNDPDGIYSLPLYDDDDLLDTDVYKNLLEQTVTQQQVSALRAERKALVARLWNDTLAGQRSEFIEKEMGKFTTGSKAQDVMLEAARGLYSALNTIERGVWSMSIAAGMAWNQPSVDRIEEALSSANMTRIEASGKIGFVARAMSEAIPSFAYNMTVGNAGIFIVEYGNAYQDSINNGETGVIANAVALPVATINTIIENMQIEGIFKLAGAGKGAKQAIKKMVKDRAYKAFLKAGARFTGQSVKTAINEGIEGGLQEGVTILIPGLITGHYPKTEDGNIDWVEVGERMGQSFVGEGLGGLGLGMGGSIINARRVQSHKMQIAGQIMSQEGVSENEALATATRVVERLVANDGDPREIYREELGKVKMADRRHKAAAHIIQRAKGIPDAQYRQIAVDATGKSSLTEMNYEEAEFFIDVLRQTKAEDVEVEEVAEGQEAPEEPTQAEFEAEVTAIREESPDVHAPLTDDLRAKLAEKRPQAPSEAVQEPTEGKVMTVFRAGDLQPKVPSPPDLEGLYFADSIELAKAYTTLEGSLAETAEKYTISLNNPATADIENSVAQELGVPDGTPEDYPVYGLPVYTDETARAVKAELQKRGYDGVIRGNGEVIAFEASAIQPPTPKAEGMTRQEAQQAALIEIKAESTKIRESFDVRIDAEIKPTAKLKLVNQRDAKIEKVAAKIAAKFEAQITQPPTGKLPGGRQAGGFLDNTPFGDDELLQAKVDAILGLPLPKAKPIKKEQAEVKQKSLKALKKVRKTEALKTAARGAIRGIDKAFGLMSTRVKNISLKLFQDIRNKVINPTRLLVAERTKAAHPFVDGINKKLNDEDRFDFEVAQWQGNEAEVTRIVEANGLMEEYQQYRRMLDEIYHEANTVGMDVDYRTAYFPSAIKDFEGLMKELNRLEEYAPIVLAMEDAQKRKGRPLNRDEQLQLVNSLLRGFRVSGLTLSKPGFAKERTLIRDDIRLIKYYHGFEESTSRYIESMTENILERKFFGRTTKELVQLRANIARTQTSIAKLESGKSKLKNPQATLERARARLVKLQAELEIADDNLLENSVANHALDLVESGAIKFDQQEELKQILEGLFKTTTSAKWIHTLRSLEYAGSLAQIPAIITQYSEIVLSLLKAPGTTLPAFVRANLGRSKIKLKDIGVAHIGQEWVDADLDKTVTALLKPFELADRVGKESFVNSVVEKYRRMAKNNPEKLNKELAKYYPEEAFASIAKSLKSGVVDNNVKGFALNELGDVQPISKFEVPELYAKAGNLRIFYMYKTFVLKRLDILRNQAYNQIKSGVKNGSSREITKGLAKLVWLAFMFSLADAGADVVKDLIRGKPLDTVDNYIIDNLLQMILLSKYSANKSRQVGLEAFFKDNITLPISNLNAAYKDIVTMMDEDSEKGSEAVRRIPWIGELYFWYMGEGARKIDEGVYDKE